jgi:hypothetical protein
MFHIPGEYCEAVGESSIVTRRNGGYIFLADALIVATSFERRSCEASAAMDRLADVTFSDEF